VNKDSKEAEGKREIKSTMNKKGASTLTGGVKSAYRGREPTEPSAATQQCTTPTAATRQLHTAGDGLKQKRDNGCDQRKGGGRCYNG
jgi:hypothetical protein